MKRTIRKGLSLIIAAVICITMFPMSALAADSDFISQDGIILDYTGTGGDVVIPDGVNLFGNIYPFTSITLGAFSDCELTSITIPESIVNIADGALYDCKTIYGYTGSAAEIYAQQHNITFVSIGGTTPLAEPSASIPTTQGTPPTPMQSNPSDFIIENGVLTDYKGTTPHILIPNGVTSLGDRAFYGFDISRDYLISVTIPEGVTSIGQSTFFACYNLESVVIPSSVTSIGEYAFLHNGMQPRILDYVTIYGISGSYAETYAKENDIPFVAITNIPTQTEPTTPMEPTMPIEKPSAWAEEQVNIAIATNLVPQNLQSNYTQVTTRAEFCALAVALYETVTGTEITERQTFSDTSDINVEKMAALGVVSGVGDNMFSPNSPLTREQAATMLSRLAAAIGKPLTEQAPTFSDNASISSWAIEAVGQMQVTNIMSGVGDNTFSPQTDYTREQSIVTLLRLYDTVK